MNHWTPEQVKWLKKYLKGRIDQCFTWWKPKNEARKRAAAGLDYGQQRCASCNNIFLRAETHVDHRQPTIKVDEGFTNWQEYLERRFCQVENLQVLCIPCHKFKSKTENSERKRHRKLREVK